MPNQKLTAAVADELWDGNISTIKDVFVTMIATVVYPTKKDIKSSIICMRS